MPAPLPRHFVDQDPAGFVAGRTLQPWQRDLIAIAEALYLRDDGPPPPQRLEWLAHQMDDFITHAGPRTRLVLRGSIAAVAKGVPLHGRHLAGIATMPVEARLQALERAERGPLALACFAVKAMSSILWYEHPDAAREIGFDGACLGRDGKDGRP